MVLGFSVVKGLSVTGDINPVHPIGNSLKKQKSCTEL